ncbi:MAG: DUF2442 domain-containing protein [Chloroflexota bacterium]|nr:DUF2442 domain-containing protein [Chloroflexota bacterium]
MSNGFNPNELHDVTHFEIVGDYTICVRFDDKTEQTINFEPILHGPMFGPLRDLALFNQVKLDCDAGTLVWPTGADIDPTVLHDWPCHVDAIVKRREQFLVLA